MAPRTRRGGRSTLRAWAALGLAGALALAGCSNLFGSKAPASKIVDVTQPPTYRMGDSLTYEENGNEQPMFVTGVHGDEVDWTDNSGAKWITFPDPTIPPRAETPKPGGPSIRRSFSPAKPTVFPLVPGKRLEYTIAERHSDQDITNRETDSCEVRAPRPLTVEAGSFDAWEIQCQRRNWLETMYYAPTVGAIVLRRRDSVAGVQRKTLVDYHKAAPGAPVPRPAPASPPAVPVTPVTPAPLAPPSAPSAEKAAPQTAEPTATPATEARPSTSTTPEPAAPTAVTPTQIPATPAPAATAPAPSPAAKAVRHRASPNAGTVTPQAGTEFVVQLAAYRSYGEASRNWEGMRTRLPEVLGDLSPRVESIKGSDGSSLVRLFVGPFDTEAAARRLCNQLHGAGQSCWVRRGP
jgi:cell division protein FtsN